MSLGLRAILGRGPGRDPARTEGDFFMSSSLAKPAAPQPQRQKQASHQHGLRTVDRGHRRVDHGPAADADRRAVRSQASRLAVDRLLAARPRAGGCWLVVLAASPGRPEDQMADRDYLWSSGG